MAYYTWSMTNLQELRIGRHCTFNPHVHLVFVTKYRRKVLNAQTRKRLKTKGLSRRESGKDHAPENLSLIRHVALNLLPQDSSAQGGIKAERLKAGWDNDYLPSILSP